MSVNNYTQVPNDLLMSLARCKLSPYESKLIFAMIRSTLGWQDPDRFISLSEIKNITKLDKRHLSRTKKRLVERGILLNGKVKTRINYNYSEWDVPQEAPPASRDDNLSSVEAVHIKKERKRVYKDKEEEKSKELIKLVFNYYCKRYEEIFGVKYSANFGRDMTIVKNLLKVCGDSEFMKKVIDKFLTSKDEWIILHSAFTIPMLSHKFNHYAMIVSKNTQPQKVKVYKGVPR